MRERKKDDSEGAGIQKVFFSCVFWMCKVFTAIVTHTRTVTIDVSPCRCEMKNHFRYEYPRSWLPFGFWNFEWADGRYEKMKKIDKQSLRLIRSEFHYANSLRYHFQMMGYGNTGWYLNLIQQRDGGLWLWWWLEWKEQILPAYFFPYKLMCNLYWSQLRQQVGNELLFFDHLLITSSVLSLWNLKNVLELSYGFLFHFVSPRYSEYDTLFSNKYLLQSYTNIPICNQVLPSVWID